MDDYLKIVACALITVLLCSAVAKQTKDFAVVIGIISCILIAIIAIDYLQPIITFFRHLQSLGELDSESILILFRCVGIALLTEIVAVICTDAGNAAIAKTLQLSAGIIVLWISLPLISQLVELVEEILLFV